MNMASPNTSHLGTGQHPIPQMQQITDPNQLNTQMTFATNTTNLSSNITGIEAAGRWMNVILTEKSRLSADKKRLHLERQSLEKKKYHLKVHELEMQQELTKSKIEMKHPLVKKIGKSILSQRA